MTKQQLKTGVAAGGDVPPVYQWDCLYLATARDEAMQFLSEEQYHHVADQFKVLAEQDDPTHSEAVDVRQLEGERNLFELRDKGGPLQKINLRVFFSVFSKLKTIVVLGAINKKNDGKTQIADIIRIRRRRRQAEGELGDGG